MLSKLKNASSYETKLSNSIKLDANYKVDNSFGIFYFLCDGAYDSLVSGSSVKIPV